MKISSSHVSLLPLNLRESYTIAYQTVDAVENVLLNLSFDNNITSTGICAPEEAVTNETPASTKQLLEETLIPVLIDNFVASSYQSCIDLLKERYADYPAARACIDFAIHNGVAKHKKITVAELLGAKHILKSIPTTITVNIHNPADTVQRVKSWMKVGYKMLKIKGGLNIEEDIQKLFLIKQSLSTIPPILFDANQGYSYDEALYFIKETKKLDLIAIEQPVNRYATEDLCRLASLNLTPIMADEAACSINDIKTLSKGGVQYFNIKLMKCGGLLEGKRLIEAALSAGKSVILSCMDECALSNAYSLSLALAYKEIKFVDLDSFTDYTDDPTRNYIDVLEGNLKLGQKL
jgi:L-alanine-DL-glutamate epimerase-like enolase superfamily enzyme